MVKMFCKKREQPYKHFITLPVLRTNLSQDEMLRAQQEQEDTYIQQIEEQRGLLREGESKG